MYLVRPFVHPAVDYLWLHARIRYDRVRSGDLSRGASAVEWVVITAIVVAIAVGIGITIKSAVTKKANEIGTDIDNAGN